MQRADSLAEPICSICCMQQYLALAAKSSMSAAHSIEERGEGE